METEPPERRDAALLFSQVHTILAQAAATALRAIEVGMPSVDYDAWSKVILENRTQPMTIARAPTGAWQVRNTAAMSTAAVVTIRQPNEQQSPSLDLGQ